MPGTLHSDNGGELTGEKLISVAQNINSAVTVTAGRSPYQNGLNDRNHAVVDRMMEVMREDSPDLHEEMCLYWALNAKNCLQMWNGFSSYQSVFGRNLALPSNMVHQLPALEGKTTSEMFAQHSAFNSLTLGKREVCTDGE